MIKNEKKKKKLNNYIKKLHSDAKSFFKKKSEWKLGNFFLNCCFNLLFILNILLFEKNFPLDYKNYIKKRRQKLEKKITIKQNSYSIKFKKTKMSNAHKKN